MSFITTCHHNVVSVRIGGVHLSEGTRWQNLTITMLDDSKHVLTLFLEPGAKVLTDMAPIVVKEDDIRAARMKHSDNLGGINDEQLG